MEEGEGPDQEWLKTEEGRWWLESDDGIYWLSTTEGRWWSQGEDAHRWYEEQGRAGWADFFEGRTWPRPPGTITPETVPALGSRVRLTNAEETLDGTAFTEGEEAIVAELQLVPWGFVFVVLRTLDGRPLKTSKPDSFEVI